MQRTTLVAALVATLGMSTAGACGVDGLIDNPFTVSHPGSFVIVVNTQRAVAEGALPTLPALDGEAAHERLEQRLEQLRARLQKARFAGSFALLVVESGHWARFTGNGRAVELDAHIAPAGDGHVLLVTEAALTALLDGRLAAGAAVRAGLVRWSGGIAPELAHGLQSALAAGS